MPAPQKLNRILLLLIALVVCSDLIVCNYIIPASSALKGVNAVSLELKNYFFYIEFFVVLPAICLILALLLAFIPDKKYSYGQKVLTLFLTLLLIAEIVGFFQIINQP